MVVTQKRDQTRGVNEEDAGGIQSIESENYLACKEKKVEGLGPN